ncbi:MAG: leucine-rich repeat domain-containing protein [Propionibacteriaceae bacterium]|nr:leucine-rich repeat domain-containing protein [Propionibacteriaceae bacterium]
MKSPLSRTISLVLGAALAIGAVVATAVPSAAVDSIIEDQNLTECIIGIMDWYYNLQPAHEGILVQEDLDNLAAAAAEEGWEHNIYCRGVSTLEGLQNLNDPSLESVGFWDSSISDLTPLATQTSLTYLQISGGQISDLTPISGLTNLTGLELPGNQISDLSPLAGLTGMEWLVLSKNQISDLTPLVGLADLNYLDVGYNPLTDISPLESLTNLTSLTLHGMPGLDLASVASIPKLTTLNLQDNQISDAGQFSGLVNLTWLNLGKNQISDLRPLAGLENLRTLMVNDNRIEDLSGLSSLPRLQILYLGNNQISDLSGLSSLVTLARISLDNNRIEDLSGLSTLVNITFLTLADNQISDLSGLINLSKLEYLVLDDNNISEVTGLSALAKGNLGMLSLMNNQITDIAPLAAFTDLDTLYLSGNKISDISPLSDFLNTSTILRSGDPDCSLDCDTTYDYWEFTHNWTLEGNQIMDLSSLDWENIGPLWDRVPYVNQDGVWDYSLTKQTILSAQSPEAGSTQPLPAVATASNSPHPITWSVASGNATINAAAGTVTFNSVGQVTLSWSDSFTAPCREYSSYGPCASETTSSALVSFFSGQIKFNVIASSTPDPTTEAPTTMPPTTAPPTTEAPTTTPPTTTPPTTEAPTTTPPTTVPPTTVPPTTEAPTTEAPTTAPPTTAAPTTSAPTTPGPTTPGPTTPPPTPTPDPSVENSTVEKSQVFGSLTSGEARLANGNDLYSLIVTLNDADGNPLTGFAEDLSVDAPSGLTVSNIIDNGDGTYFVKLTSKTPGNYDVTVLLNDNQIGDSIPLNFISAAVSKASVVAGESLTALGFGFLPGEDVTVVVNSTPINVGTFRALPNGTVTVTFTIPKNFAAGAHTVTLTGMNSGLVRIAFNVRMAGPDVPTGGTSLPSGSLGWVAVLVIGGAALFSMGMLRRQAR